MSPEVQKLVAKAVIRLLDNNMEQFRAWVSAAIEQYKIEADRNRLHATIEEILRYKGLQINF